MSCSSLLATAQDTYTSATRLRFHRQNVGSMDTFKTLTEAAKATGAQTWLPHLVEANIVKPSDVVARVEPDPALQMPATTWAALRQHLLKKQEEGWRASTRCDGTPVAQTAGTATLSGTSQNRSTQDLTTLLTDIHGPLQGGLSDHHKRCWRRMAHIWGIPFHVMPHDLESSARELTDALRQKWGAANIRHLIDISEVDTKHFQTWPQARRITYHTLVVGAQFLATVDELMNTTRSHIKLDHDRCIVTWTLPASQLGTRGPTRDISLKCTCAIAGKRMCPYHNMATILDLNMATSESGTDDDQTIFRQESQDSTELLGYIHQMLRDSHTQVQGSHSSGQITNLAGDLPRALGTRFLARLGFSTRLILLLARWDSPTILQHLIGGTLADLQHQADSLQDRDAPHQPQPDEELDKTKEEIQADLSELAQQCHQLIQQIEDLNPTPPLVVGTYCHKPDEHEDTTPVWEWSTPCGWQYGEARFMRAHSGSKFCQICFTPASAADTDTSDRRAPSKPSDS